MKITLIVIGFICVAALVAELCLIAPDKMPWNLWNRRKKK